MSTITRFSDCIRAMVNVIFVIVFVAFPAIAYAEDDVYVAVDSEGNPSARIIGEGAPARLADSVVEIDRASWRFGTTKVVVSGIPYTRADFEESYEFELEILPTPRAAAQGARVFDISELKAALTALYGEEGDALIYACDRNLIWQLVHDAWWDTTDIIELNGYHYFQVQDNVPVNEAAQEVFEEFQSRVDPWTGVLNMPPWETNTLKDYLRRVNGLASDYDMDLALYEHWAATLPAKLEFVQKHATTIAGIVMTLPAMAGGAGADVVMSIGSLYNNLKEGQDPTWDVLALVPYMRLPKGVHAVAFKITGIPGRAAIQFSADTIAKLRSILSDITEKTIASGEKLILKRLEKVVDSGFTDEVTEMGCSGIFCFTAGTEIVTPSGLVPIEALRAGDEVMSWSEAQNAIAVSRVQEAFHGRASKSIRLNIGRDVVEVTPEHPVHSVERGWICARDVKNGEYLSANSGHAKVNHALEINHGDGIDVFNILIEGTHSYFVSSNGILFHNGGCWNEYLAKYHDGKVLNAITDPALTGKVVRGLFRATRRGVINIQAQALAKALRALRPGNHEWLPVNRIYNVLFHKIQNGDEAKKVLKFMDDARIDVNKLWFNKIKDPKTGIAGISSVNNRPYGHVGGRHPNGARYTKVEGVEYKFHSACDAAFDKAVEGGTFNIDTWEQEMRENVLEKFFEGDQLTLITTEFDAALAKWTP